MKKTGFDQVFLLKLRKKEKKKERKKERRKHIDPWLITLDKINTLPFYL